MSRKRYRPKKERQTTVAECDWCASPFAREMSGGRFCDFVCKQQFVVDAKDNRPTQMMTVSEVIEASEGGSQE